MSLHVAKLEIVQNTGLHRNERSDEKYVNKRAATATVLGARRVAWKRIKPEAAEIADNKAAERNSIRSHPIKPRPETQATP
jgi:hypothetical protein